jgi:coenzyme F420-reducing hydrogenase beta subunit
MNKVTRPTIRQIYYGWNKNFDERRLGSSGGIFSALADAVQEKNGVVFGAIFNEENEVLHASSLDCDIQKFRKSKYVESDLKNTFKEAAFHLESGRIVLFSGCPCQIAGLKNLTKSIQENLYTIDFVCHGVPAQRLFRKHISQRENKYASKAIKVDFRPKTHGWSQHYIRMEFSNGKLYERPYLLDPYFLAFAKNVSLRKSCYECPFAGSHPSDITLADFWRIDRIAPEKNDDRGVSLVFINSKKGNDLMSQCRNGYELYELDYQVAKYCLKNKENKLDFKAREKFMEMVVRKGLEKATMNMFGKEIILFRLKYFIKNYLEKIRHRGKR